MAKNLAIFCDGTGNEPKAKGKTNVLRLYGMALESPTQTRFYSAGVGTLESPKALTAIGRRISRLFGLALGYGLKANVVDCYTFLMRHWEPGDSIYLFGFSRGAYTARALAGMLRVVGLLRPEQENMVPYALKLFWKAHGKNIDWDDVKEFTPQFSRPEFERWGYPVRFLGIWDTVKAVGWFRRRLRLPYTRLLKSVRTVRHACSLDEWRGQYKAYLVSEEETKAGRDFCEVWFAGVHSDVGGAFKLDPELGNIAMAWIGSEATDAGLELDEDAFAFYRTLPPSTALGKVHPMGRYWVLGGISRRRAIPAGARVHRSVKIRMDTSPRARTRYSKKGITEDNPVESWGDH